jgi:hypothetical protein
MVHVVDWLPTLLSAAGYDLGKLPADLNGLDQWKILSTNSTPRRTEFLYNIDPKAWAIRVQDMKLIYGHGTTGRYDGWYKPEQLAREVNISKISVKHDDPEHFMTEYNLLAVDTERARRAWDTPAAEDTANAEQAPGDMFRSDLTDILLDIGRGGQKGSPYIVKCPYRPANYSTNCQPTVKPCLFNIAQDPCELDNLADRMPEVVEELVERMNLYQRSAVPPRNKKPDPKGFPYYHNGIWGPWIKL